MSGQAATLTRAAATAAAKSVEVNRPKSNNAKEPKGPMGAKVGKVHY